jgi:flavin reductase (DIM6/NTAB) family NADH-FMN oxidoreductase RutF
MNVLETAGIAPAALYKLLVDLVTPRPIAWVSSLSAAGEPNLAPFSFFNLVSTNPPVCFFSVSTPSRATGPKDTLANVREVPEFVVHIVTEDLAGAMNATAASLPRGESEFAHAGLTPVPSRLVRPPRVAEAPAALECRVLDIRTLGTGPGAGNMVLGEIVCLHLEDGLQTEDGRVPIARLRTIGRLGGDSYVRCAPGFELPRPG